MKLALTPSTMEIRRSGASRSFSTFNIGRGVSTLQISKPQNLVEIVTPNDLGTTRRLEPLVIMLIGRRGRGKTQGMTWMGGFQKETYKRFNMPNLIGANYWTSYADILNPNLVEWFNSDGMFDPRARNMYALVDEAGGQFSNRRSLSRVNVDFMQVLTQIRKLETEMVFTTQFPQWIDIGVLYQIDLFIMMDGRNGNRQIDMYIWDWWGQWTGRMHRKIWPPQMSDVDRTYTILDADIVFGEFESRQIVPPVWAKNKNQIIIDQWGEDYKDMDVAGEIGAEITERAKSLMSLEPPKSIDELMERHDEGEGVRINEVLHFAKRIDPEIKRRAHLEEHLKKAGWNIENGVAWK